MTVRQLAAFCGDNAGVRLLIVLSFLLIATPGQALEKVRLQLNWKHQFQFAGYYAAIEQGYFREAGFEVTLNEISEGQDPVETVLKGQAEFGIAASELALARARGQPVVALAAIIQHSPLVLLVNRRRIPSIDALNDRRIMLMPHETELYAYLRAEGINRYIPVPSHFDAADLIAGRVEAISGYSTDEPFLLREAGFPYTSFTPDAVGIDFYGDTLFTTEAQIKASPRAVEAFRQAVLRGWRYAMAHPEPVADLILSRYSQRHGRAHLLFEAAELKRLMQPDLVEIGLMSPTRWQQIGQTYAEQGMLPARFSLDGLIYQPEPPMLLPWARTALLLGGGVMLAAAALAAYLARLNRRLKGEIAARQQSEQALRDGEERYRRLAEQSQDVIWTLDLASRRFSYVSPAVERVRGFTAEEVMAQPLEKAMSADSYSRVMNILEDHLTRLAAGDMSAMSAMAEIDQPRKDGSTMTSEVVASFMLDETDRPVALLGVARDISARRSGEAQLRQANLQLRHQLDEIQRLQSALQAQAVSDSLTGCFNRRYLDETLERELSRARREEYSMSLLILDLDHFKQINDSYGHPAGDDALKELARRLQGDIRQEDVLCRYGGEEFVVLMPRMSFDSAAQRAEAWRRMIESIRIRCDGGVFGFTASIGVASFPEHGQGSEELMQSADLALYIAKREGRNRVMVYTTDGLIGS